MTNYEQAVAWCDAALARQTATMARLAPNTAAYAVAEGTLAAMRNTKTILMLNRRRRLVARIDRLRFGLLAQYRMRGEIIASAARRIDPKVLFAALEVRGDDLDEIYQCLELYQNWREFCEAQRCYRVEGQGLPGNLNDAIASLNQWKRRRTLLH